MLDRAIFSVPSPWRSIFCMSIHELPFLRNIASAKEALSSFTIAEKQYFPDVNFSSEKTGGFLLKSGGSGGGVI